MITKENEHRALHFAAYSRGSSKASPYLRNVIVPLNRLADTGQPIQPPPDVQRTTMSLDVLGRFVCNTWDEAINNGGAPFDAVIVGGGMFGGYCADKISRSSGPRPLRVLVLEAGPFLVPTHVQNLPQAGLDVPDPIFPSADSGAARDLVWGIPWRSNVQFVGQAYCVGGKSLYWGGWCPRLQADDLASWPPSVAQYLTQNYPTLEQQTGVADSTDFIQGPLFNLLKTRFTALSQDGSVANVSGVEDPPLAVQGQSPASGLFAFDKYSSVTVLIDAAREAAGQSDAQRRLFVVPECPCHSLGHGERRGDRAACLRERRRAISADQRQLLGDPRRRHHRIDATGPALVSDQPEQFRQGTDGTKPHLARPQQHVFQGHAVRARSRQYACRRCCRPAALLVRGTAPQGKFQIQVTASADMRRKLRRAAVRHDPRHRPARRALGEPAGGLDLVRASAAPRS